MTKPELLKSYPPVPQHMRNDKYFTKQGFDPTSRSIGNQRLILSYAKRGMPLSYMDAYLPETSSADDLRGFSAGFDIRLYKDLTMDPHTYVKSLLPGESDEETEAFLCFKDKILVGKSRNECRVLAKEFQILLKIGDELDYLAEREREGYTPLNLENKPATDVEFNWHGITVGNPLPSSLKECNVDRRYLKQVKKSGPPCYITLLQDRTVRVHNLPVLGHPATTYLELVNGKVRRIAIISKNYDRKDFAYQIMKVLKNDYGKPRYYDTAQVSDSNARFFSKFLAYWNLRGITLYMTNTGNLSPRGLVLVPPIK
ncbi:MAG: hypothetical protein HQL71_08935 [Magnetococcales bacterium]|nr:hypothetical protein [Magnetococcales bacterium]